MKSLFSINKNCVIFFTKLIWFEAIWMIPMENKISSFCDWQIFLDYFSDIQI